MFGHQNDVHKTESILEDRVKRITANRSRKRERERVDIKSKPKAYAISKNVWRCWKVDEIA